VLLHPVLEVPVGRCRPNRVRYYRWDSREWPWPNPFHAFSFTTNLVVHRRRPSTLQPTRRLSSDQHHPQVRRHCLQADNVTSAPYYNRYFCITHDWELNCLVSTRGSAFLVQLAVNQIEKCSRDFLEKIQHFRHTKDIKVASDILT
jgi:hypothetical protein